MESVLPDRRPILHERPSELVAVEPDARADERSALFVERLRRASRRARGQLAREVRRDGRRSRAKCRGRPRCACGRAGRCLPCRSRNRLRRSRSRRGSRSAATAKLPPRIRGRVLAPAAVPPVDELLPREDAARRRVPRPTRARRSERSSGVSARLVATSRSTTEPVRNSPGIARRRYTATRSRNGMQSPSRKISSWEDVLSAATFWMRALQNPSSGCQTWRTAKGSEGARRSASWPAGGIEPSSASITSKCGSVCAASAASSSSQLAHLVVDRDDDGGRGSRCTESRNRARARHTASPLRRAAKSVLVSSTGSAVAALGGGCELGRRWPSPS